MPSLAFTREPLPANDDDLPLGDDLLAELAIVAGLRRRPALYRFRGSVALRRCRAGSVVINRGERNGRAFYALTAADVLAVLHRPSGPRPRPADRALAAEREAVRVLAGRPDGPGDLLRLTVPAGPRTVDRGDLAAPAGPEPLGPRYAYVRAGEVFGDAACLDGTPQPASVVALRDWYLLEMRADFLAAVFDDPGYRTRAEESYRAVVLRTQLERVPLFSGLAADDFTRLAELTELRTARAGQVICDEHEPCDGLYVVRSGVVRLVRNASLLFGESDVADWARLLEVLREGVSGRSARAAVWRRLPALTRGVLLRRSNPDALSARDRVQILAALNGLVTSADLSDEPEILPLIEGVLAFRNAGASRRAHREALEDVLGAAVRPLGRNRGPEYVLHYCSRGEVFGLRDLLRGTPRTASAIAVGHPNAPGSVDLAWIPAEAIRALLSQSPQLAARVREETVRVGRLERLAETPAWESPARGLTEEAVALGLVQGQELMLVDLERCTRCDECVRACAESRDDGRTRLFLDGPRFGKYLVPATCRACLDPVCLIGCPVTSIHRGPRREIVIEDWCIGCGLCAESCPYGAIQMHDQGVLPDAASGWEVLPAADVPGDDWLRPGSVAPAGVTGSSPFVLDRTLLEVLRQLGHGRASRAIRFRRQVNIPSPTAGRAFRLEVVAGGELRVWLDGQELVPSEKPRGSRRVYRVTVDPFCRVSGKPVLAAEVELPPEDLASGTVLFQARLDALPTPPPSEERVGHVDRPVTRRAAVCDLCVGLPGGPACVRACAHDAALRVNARAGLPA